MYIYLKRILKPQQKATLNVITPLTFVAVGSVRLPSGSRQAVWINHSAAELSYPSQSTYILLIKTKKRHLEYNNVCIKEKRPDRHGEGAASSYCCR